MENFKRISFILATLCIAAALAIKLTRPEWQQYANYALIAGIVFFFVSLWFERRELLNFFTARSTKHGLNSLIMVIFVLAIIGLANWIVNRHPMKYDTTKNKRYTLSSLTINAVKELKVPVKITAFFTEQDPAMKADMKALLDNYKIHSKQLQAEVVDPSKNPRLMQQYAIEANATTVLEAGDQKTTVTTTSEEDITNAILRITSSKKTTVYFLEGHGEPAIADFENSGLSSLVDELKKKSYGIQELKNLASANKIPDDCNTLVIVSPKAAMLDHEIAAIQKFLDAGGRALILDDPQADPSLGKLLGHYGVIGGNDIVVDDKYYYPLADIAVPAILHKEGSPITREFNTQMFFPVTRSLTSKTEAETKDTTTVIAESTEFSWAETDKEKALFEEDKDRRGPITVGLTITRPIEAADKKSPEMRLVIFGDENFAENSFIGFPGNRQILLNSMAWLTEQENLIHLPPRDDKTDMMILTSTQMNYLFLLLVIVMPGAMIAAGIFVWVRRKKL